MDQSQRKAVSKFNDENQIVNQSDEAQKNRIGLLTKQLEHCKLELKREEEENDNLKEEVRKLKSLKGFTQSQSFQESFDQAPKGVDAFNQAIQKMKATEDKQRVEIELLKSDNAQKNLEI